MKFFNLTPHTFLLVVLSLFVFSNTMYAQYSSPKFDQLTIEDGLSQSSVFSILEDSRGFMWFGTRAGGLNKYDGYSFTVYKHNDNDSLSISDNEIRALQEDLDGNIWVGTRNNGINKFDYDTGEFHKYLNNKTDSLSLPSNLIHCIYTDVYNEMWIGTDKGLVYYSKELDKFLTYEKDDLSQTAVKTIITSSVDSLAWVGTKTGLYLLDVKNHKTLKHFKHDKNNKISLTKDYVSALQIDKKGRLWIGLYDGGLNRLDNINSGVFKKYQHKKSDKKSLASDVIRKIHVGKDGTIWIATKSGLDELVPSEQDKAKPLFIHHKKDHEDERSISANSLYSFYEDSKGDYWIGTYTDGVNYIYNGPVKFENYSTYDNNFKGINNNVINVFFINGAETWIGTKGGGLNLYNKNTGKYNYFKYNKNNPKGVLSDNIKSILIDSDSLFWVGASRGLSLFNKEKNEFTPIIKDIDAISLEEGMSGELWIGTNKELIKLNKSNLSFKRYTSNQNNSKSLSSNNVNKVFKDSKGRIWIATKTGLNKYNRAEDNFTQYTNDYVDTSSISHSNVTSICEDINGNIWFGTYDGLNKYDENKGNFIHYGELNGLPGNVISNILSDDKGNLWITSNDILAVFNPEEDNNGTCIRNYDKRDGLQKGEFRLNAAYKSISGDMYLGGNNGYNKFNPSHVVDNVNIPKVAITDFKLFNKSIVENEEDKELVLQFRNSKSICLNYKQSVFTISFVALSYSSPSKNQFAHKMEGFDADWNYIGNKREATYTNLPAGDYVFRVEASNNDGVWNKEGAQLKITILPPWWETLWFKAFILLLLIAIIVGGYFYKINELKRQKEVLGEKVLERTSELQKANTKLEDSNEEILIQKESILLQNKELENQKCKIEKAYNNIETLSKIGKEITMSLSVEEIVEIAYQSLQLMMNVPVFSIGIYDEQKNELVFKGTKQLGETIPEYSYKLEDLARISVWCFRNQCEVLINDFEKEHHKFVSEIKDPLGGKLPSSLICIPLNVKGKKIGVISVQSHKKHLYTVYHQNIIQNIGIYTAIALDNAEAYDKIENQALSLIEQKTALEETNATKDKFYSILAHDLKNPLGAMVGFLEILKVNFSEYSDEKRISLIDYAFKSATSIKDLINNLLQWSQAQKGTMPFNPEMVDLRAVVDAEISLLTSMAENKEIELQLSFKPKEIVLRADKNMLSTVMRNIVSNAIKFSFHKSNIKIDIEDIGEEIKFQVIDSGVGIPKSFVDKLFRIDLNYKREGTAKEKGTGMGLALCKEFVDVHKGEIWAESEEGKGCTISFIIPKNL
ncbi:two-component regulator propeller domain-containing protein [Lutibacter holmesii]|uniref:histidine kinase n=1 Tax=Lutibacter holmesii TaxID=1137985 RepID=A0ABW3WIQ8_9FLAO